MSDASLNRFLASGTNAERLAFTPTPPTPASGPDPTYLWHETDTGDTYAWDFDGAAWNQVNNGGGGGGGDLLSTNNLSDVANAGTARSNLGLAIGSDVQAYDAGLSSLGGLSTTGKIYYLSAADTWSPVTVGTGLDFTTGTLSATGGGGSGDLLSTNNLSDLANIATARTNLGLAIGTDVQAYDAELAAIAGLTSAADRLPYFTGSGTASLATFTTAGRALIDDADAAAQRTTLGLTALATASMAVASDINTGTDTAKPLNSDALAGSNFGKAVVTILVSDPAGSAITTGDGKAYYRVPSTLNGMNLVAVAAAVTTVSSSGIPTVQIANVTDAVDMLSTKLTIDASETDSSTAATAAVIDTTKDDVATGDMLRIDIDVAGTGAKGLMVEMQFQLP